VQLRSLGSTGERVPSIGLGTWKLDLESPSLAVAVLQAGLDAGLSLIDTAEVYGNGHVERIVSRAITGRRRQRAFVVSKVLPLNASRAGTIAACERTLRRLRSDTVDLYLLHWPGPHPLADTLESFLRLQQQGKIRFWGVSNFDVPHLVDATRITGPRTLTTNQVLYNLTARAIERSVLPWCVRNDVTVMAYSPFGSGRFPSDRSRQGRTLRRIAEAHGATVRQIALAFLTRHPNMIAIPKAGSIPHVLENARACCLSLSPAEVVDLEAAAPLQGKRPYLPRP